MSPQSGYEIHGYCRESERLDEFPLRRCETIGDIVFSRGLARPRTSESAAFLLQWLRGSWIAYGWNGKTNGKTMAKSISTRSAKSKAASSSHRLRGAAKQSGSSRCVKPMPRKSGDTVSISADAGRVVKIDWAKVDATNETDVARHAKQDNSPTPSDRQWQRMVKGSSVALVPPTTVDVRGIRERLHLSQSEFAARFGFTTAAIQQWEQGRRLPHGPARVLLAIIDREPNAVRRALAMAAVIKK